MRLSLPTDTQAEKYMSVKYVGVVEGEIGVLTSRVPVNDNRLIRQPIVTTMTGRHSVDRLLNSMKPNAKKMVQFSTPLMEVKKKSKPILPSERLLLDRFKKEREAR